MPTISVIVPVYNVEQYLPRCVDSILAQTYPDFELILVDDGSPDRCGELCEKYARNDERVVVLHQKNQGLSAARNVGLDWLFANSNSEWLTFVDSDDWIHPQYLELLLRANLVHHTLVSNTKMCRTDKYVNPKPISSPRSYCCQPEEIYLGSSDWVQSYACGRLIHRKLFAEIRFPVSRVWEDLATTYRYLFAVDSVSVVDEPLYYYFSNPKGISNTSWNPSYLDALVAYDEILSFFLTYKQGALYPRILSSYAMVCASQIDLIQNRCAASVQAPKIYQKQLRKKLAFLLHQIRKNSFLNRRSLKRNIFLISRLSPFLTRCFEKFYAIYAASKQ